MRFWIETGFNALKSVGWQRRKTRRTDPARVERHWLVLSVATLLTLAFGSRADDANALKRNPSAPRRKMSRAWSVVSQRRLRAFIRIRIFRDWRDFQDFTSPILRFSP